MPVLRVDIIGSADRGTIIRPLDDVDLLAVFDADAYTNTYRWNSSGFITRVRDALNEGGASIVGTRGQAVRIFYTSGPKVDVAPVFALQGGGYFLPNGTGGWMTTNPDFHRDWIAERHRDLNYHLKPLARAIKRWNRVHSERLSSFHIEVMVGRIFSSLGSDYRQAAAMFFTHASNYLHANDPAGHSGDLAAKFTWNKQQAILQSFTSARDRADKAVAAEARGDHAEAIRLWRIVFGDEFPSYG
jgi:YD repeat-containing protein